MTGVWCESLPLHHVWERIFGTVSTGDTVTQVWALNSGHQLASKCYIHPNHFPVLFFNFYVACTRGLFMANVEMSKIFRNSNVEESINQYPCLCYDKTILQSHSFTRQPPKSLQNHPTNKQTNKQTRTQQISVWCLWCGTSQRKPAANVLCSCSGFEDTWFLMWIRTDA